MNDMFFGSIVILNSMMRPVGCNHCLEHQIGDGQSGIQRWASHAFSVSQGKSGLRHSGLPGWRLLQQLMSSAVEAANRKLGRTSFRFFLFLAFVSTAFLPAAH